MGARGGARATERGSRRRALARRTSNMVFETLKVCVFVREADARFISARRIERDAACVRRKTVQVMENLPPEF